MIHNITTNCNKDRIILSISLKDKYNDYNTIKQMYEQQLIYYDNL